MSQGWKQGRCSTRQPRATLTVTGSDSDSDRPAHHPSHNHHACAQTVDNSLSAPRQRQPRRIRSSHSFIVHCFCPSAVCFLASFWRLRAFLQARARAWPHDGSRQGGMGRPSLPARSAQGHKAAQHVPGAQRRIRTKKSPAEAKAKANPGAAEDHGTALSGSAGNDHHHPGVYIVHSRTSNRFIVKTRGKGAKYIGRCTTHQDAVPRPASYHATAVLQSKTGQCGSTHQTPLRPCMQQPHGRRMLHAASRMPRCVFDNQGSASSSGWRRCRCR